MFQIEGYEWIIYALSIFTVMLLGNLSEKNVKNKFKGKTELVKKICLGIFVISSMYWIITFPYVRSYYNFSGKSDYSSDINAEKQSDYIIENRRRIEDLESELKETRDELKAVVGRINLILQITMYGLIFFGSSRIFTSNKTDSE